MGKHKAKSHVNGRFCKTKVNHGSSGGQAVGQAQIKPDKLDPCVPSGSTTEENKQKCKNWLMVGVGITTVIFVPCFGFYLSKNHLNNEPYGNMAPDLGPEKCTIELGHQQQVSLFEVYAMDFHNFSKTREENMKKYTYNFSRNGVDKRSDLSMQEFWDVYDGKWPVIVTDVVSKWPAFKWTRDFFFENFGQERVTMKAVDNGLENAVSLALPLELFYKNTYQAYPQRWTYIEDEFFIPMRPTLRRDIGDCMYLEEDFYQLFPSEVRPWNAMLLWGTMYSRSSLHIDPYNWTGTNAILKGRKRWKLYPPGQDHLLYVKTGQMSGFPLDCYKYNSPVDAYEPNQMKYPRFEEAKAIEVDQLPGEILFIPSGWFHQAFNMEETIAVSSQMMNRHNYRIVLEEILKVANVKRKDLPKDIDEMAPAKQVETVMNLLPQEMLDHGRQVTQDAIQQINSIPKENNYLMPFP